MTTHDDFVWAALTNSQEEWDEAFLKWQAVLEQKTNIPCDLKAAAPVPPAESPPWHLFPIGRALKTATPFKFINQKKAMMKSAGNLLLLYFQRAHRLRRPVLLSPHRDHRLHICFPLDNA